MFAVSTCHLVLQWIGDMNQIQTELSGGFIEIAEVVTTYVDIYLPIINVSSLVSSFLTLVDHFAVFFERWNCPLEGMDHVGTQSESLDIHRAIFLSIYR